MIRSDAHPACYSVGMLGILPRGGGGGGQRGRVVKLRNQLPSAKSNYTCTPPYTFREKEQCLF
jgi:hypothetical protein